MNKKKQIKETEKDFYVDDIIAGGCTVEVSQLQAGTISENYFGGDLYARESKLPMPLRCTGSCDSP